MKIYLLLIMLGSFNCFADNSTYPQSYNPILSDTIKEALVQSESASGSNNSSYIAYDKKEHSRSIGLDSTKIDIKIPLIWYTESF